MLLNVDNLQVAYGGILALQGVSLSIAAGEIVTLIGSNGAGKTTLLRTISGLLRPRNGSIRWEDTVELVGMAAHRIVRQGISHVPEGRQIFADMSVRENLALGAYQRRDRAGVAADMDRCFTRFPILAQRRAQAAGTLSGGEQQMLAIGRALMARPRLLLLDEPSLGLAPLVVRQIFDIIREINQTGTTIFLVEQNAHLALGVANRAYVLQSGRVIKSDAAAKLLEDPEVRKAYLGG
jgi:branched-chain amino acid transport system ATP-binding protein